MGYFNVQPEKKKLLLHTKRNAACSVILWRTKKLSYNVWQYVILNVADNQCKNNFQCNLEAKCFSGISRLGGISQHGIQLQKVHFVNLLPLHLSLASLCDLTPWSLSVLSFRILAHFKMLKIFRILWIQESQVLHAFRWYQTVD